MKYMKPLNLYKEIFTEILMKKDSKHGRLLGLDVGDKYVTLAVSDWKNITAVPLSRALDRQENNMVSKAADIFQSLIAEHNLVGFIVSNDFKLCNYEVTGEATVTGEAIDGSTEYFMIDLYKTGKFKGLRWAFWDLGFTSKNAEFVFKGHLKFILENLNQPQDISKAIMEEPHAVSALQGYLDYANKMVEEGLA